MRGDKAEWSQAGPADHIPDQIQADMPLNSQPVRSELLKGDLAEGRTQTRKTVPTSHPEGLCLKHPRGTLEPTKSEMLFFGREVQQLDQNPRVRFTESLNSFSLATLSPNSQYPIPGA